MSKKGGFTLIEVMVSVMIISVVVVALLQLQANNTHTFLQLQKAQKNLQYASLLQGSKYGYENDSLTLDRTLERFDLDDDLRRELKKIEAKIIYQKLETIDTGEFDESLGEEEGLGEDTQAPLAIEIGRSVLQLQEGSTSILRVRLR